MYRFKQAASCAIALAAITLAGCTTAAPKPSGIELQRSAMQRWNACLERNVDPQKMTANRISQLVRVDCEGHKRDVIASFPPHMEKQIEQMLISNAYQLVDSGESSRDVTTKHGELISTLLR